MVDEGGLEKKAFSPPGGKELAADQPPPALECEVRGNLWEGIHAAVFYVAVACAVLSSVGVHRLALGIACVVLLAYSIFAIFSSPTFVRVEPDGSGVTVEKYRYFIPRRRWFPREQLRGITVIESPREPSAPGEKGSKRDLSYFVRVYLEAEGGRRFNLFRSGISGSPYENREKAYLITESASRTLNLPVFYGRRGVGEEQG